MTRHPGIAGRVRTPILLALALLILAGLGVWLWPDDASEAQRSGDATDHEPSESMPRTRERRPERPDLAHEAKASASGTVRAFGGEPLADAQVCATSARNQLHGLDQGRPRCTRTGSDGHWRIEGLWPVRTQFSASAPAHEPRAWRRKDERGHWHDYATLEPGSDTTGIDFELRPGGVRVAGVIEDLAGGPIEGAVIEGRSERPGIGGPRPHTVAISDAEGRFELWMSPGRSRVSAIAEGYARSAQQVWAPTERAELFLTPESVLVGRVVHAETGEPVADVTVGLGFAGPFDPDGASVRSDAEGRFRIAGLTPGIYKPVATADHFHGQAAKQVHLGLAQTSEPIELRVHPMALIEGRVLVAGSDEGCRAGSVDLTRTDQSDRASAPTDDEGRVSLRGVRPGEYRVAVACAGYVADEDYPTLVVGSEDSSEHVWEVREGQAIRGVVVDGEGRPVSLASVRARMLVDASNARAQTTNARASECEDDGSFELRGLLPGRYEITVRAEHPTPEQPLIVDLPVGSDVGDVRIELSSGGTITGRVIDEQGNPQPGAGIRAHALGKRDQFQTVADDQGNFVLERVRPGEVRVEASTHVGGPSMRSPGSSDDDEPGEKVEVVAGGTVEVELRVESRTGVIRGKVLDEHGAAVDDAFVRVERLSDSATASAEQGITAARSRGSRPVLSDAEGGFVVEELAPGNYAVRAERRGGGEAVAESVPVGGSIELVIAATGLLAGKVVIAGAEPPERFRVSASDATQRFDDQFFRTEGRWELDRLPAGKFEITVESNLGTATLEVELSPGERREDLELSLEPRVTYRGRLIDIDTRAPVPGMEVGLFSAAGSYSRSGSGTLAHVSDAEGRFELENVGAGSVTLWVSTRSGGSTSNYEGGLFSCEVASEPAVQDGGDFELVARRLEPGEVAGDLGFALAKPSPRVGIVSDGSELRVALIRPGGPAAATELAIDDVIETVDGKSVRGADARRYGSLTRVAPGTVLELGLAKGKTVALTVGPPIR